MQEKGKSEKEMKKRKGKGEKKGKGKGEEEKEQESVFPTSEGNPGLFLAWIGIFGKRELGLDPADAQAPDAVPGLCLPLPTIPRFPFNQTRTDSWPTPGKPLWIRFFPSEAELWRLWNI